MLLPTHKNKQKKFRKNSSPIARQFHIKTNRKIIIKLKEKKRIRTISEKKKKRKKRNTNLKRKQEVEEEWINRPRQSEEFEIGGMRKWKVGFF